MPIEEHTPKLFLSILDPERRKLLPLLAPLKSRFYLAGDTALALQKKVIEIVLTSIFLLQTHLIWQSLSIV